jgi:hypothetical protein
MKWDQLLSNPGLEDHDRQRSDENVEAVLEKFKNEPGTSVRRASAEVLWTNRQFNEIPLGTKEHRLKAYRRTMKTINFLDGIVLTTLVYRIKSFFIFCLPNKFYNHLCCEVFVDRLNINM